MSNYANEAGEPYMTAAQLNFEAALDEQYAYERQFDMDDDFYGEEEDDDTPYLTEDYDFHNEQSAMEDQWLDGSYEE